MKTCSKCGIKKEDCCFHSDVSKKDGLRCACKDCEKKRKKKRYQRHKEEIKRKAREYHYKNKETANERSKSWYHTHKEESAEKSKNWQNKNREKVRKTNRLFQRKRRALKKHLDEVFTKEDEKYIYDIFNNKCFNCGSADKLEIDHHYPLSKGNVLNRNNAVLLCKSCNCSKRDRLPDEFYTKEQLKKINLILQKAG